MDEALMMRPRSVRWVASLAAVVLLLPGCGGNADDSADTTLAPVTTTVATTTTTTPDPTSTTTTSPQTTTTESPSSTAPAGNETLLYVAMGDSAAFTPPSPDGLIYRYSDMLADHFGADVDLRNRAEGSIHSTTMLEALRTDERLRAELADADAVTTNIPINVWIEPLMTVGGLQGRDPADCGGDDQQCLRDALETYKADTDAIIDEIVAICDDDALIRLYDTYMIGTGYKIETNTLHISNPYWKAGMDYIEESAARYGIPVAQVYDAFMGPDGADDPYVKGLLDDDQLHPNAEGAAVMADLLNQFGY